MKLLLSRKEFGKFEFIPDTVISEQNLNKSIQEAQLFDVKKWLGDALLSELLSEYTDNDLTDLNISLLNGCEYTYNDTTYFFEGLRACIAYFAWSRYVKRDSLNYTTTGIVKKNDTLSEPATNKDLQMLSGDALSSADALKLDVIDYLNRNRLSYPLWNCTTKRRIPTFKIVGE